VELQRRYDDIRKQGLGLVAISYDSPDTLKAFAESRGITFPLIADRDSAMIRAFGIFNNLEQPGARGYGIPHPGTFIVDRDGTVISRFFEDAYQERYTAAAILSTLDRTAPALTAAASTAHLSMTVSLSDAAAAPGERLALGVAVTPARGIHVYAPGGHDYQVVNLAIDPQPWLRVHATSYPRSEIYHFKPLDERVPVYMKPFELRRDVTLLATPEAQKQLAAMPSVTITGALEYQACDDRVCFNPARVPFSLTVKMNALDRR
jgi:peroxiredoxin